MKAFWQEDYQWELGPVPVSDMDKNIMYEDPESISYIYRDWKYVAPNIITNIHMIGNGVFPGKGAMWTTIDPDITTITKIEFDYNIDFGDSFTMAGVLFNIKEEKVSINYADRSGKITCYLLSFNNLFLGWDEVGEDRIYSGQSKY